MNALVGIYRDECQLLEDTNATHVCVDDVNAMYVYLFISGIENREEGLNKKRKKYLKKIYLSLNICM